MTRQDQGYALRGDIDADRGIGGTGERTRPHAVLLAAAVVIALAGCDSPAKEAVRKDAATAMTVSVTTAQRRDVAITVSATGTVMPWQELTIDAPTGGLTVVEVRVDENDIVKTGDVLVRFDDRQLRAQVAQQKAAVTEAQANLDSAKAEAARGDVLVQQKAMSLEAVETRRTAIRTSQAKLDQAQAALDQLMVQLAQTVIHAPAGGIVSLQPVRIGTVPQAGAELVRLIRDGRLEVQAKVPERDLARLKAGQDARVAAPDGNPIAARLRGVAAKVDTTTRLGIAYIGLPAGSPLKTGMFTTVDVTTGTGGALTIPEQALVWPDGKPSAFVVGADDTVVLKRLDTGDRQNGDIVVTEGLRDGDRVAVAGVGFLHDGDKVRVETALAVDTGTSVR